MELHWPAPRPADAEEAIGDVLASEARVFLLPLHREMRNALATLAAAEGDLTAARSGAASPRTPVWDRVMDEARRAEAARIMQSLARLPIAHVRLDRNSATRHQIEQHAWTAAAEVATALVRSLTAASAMVDALPLLQTPHSAVENATLIARLNALQAAVPVPLLPSLPSHVALTEAAVLPTSLYALMQARFELAFRTATEATAAALTARASAAEAGGSAVDPLPVPTTEEVDIARSLLRKLIGVATATPPALRGFDLHAIMAGRAIGPVDVVFSGPAPVPAEAAHAAATANPAPAWMSLHVPTLSAAAAASLGESAGAAAFMGTSIIPTVTASALAGLAGASTSAMMRMSLAGPDHVALVRARQESLEEAAFQRRTNPIWLRLIATMLATRLKAQWRLWRVRRASRELRRRGASLVGRLLPAHLAALAMLQRFARSVPYRRARWVLRDLRRLALRRVVKALVTVEGAFAEVAAPQLEAATKLAAAEEEAVATARENLAAIRAEVEAEGSAAAKAAYDREMMRPLPREWVRMQAGVEGDMRVSYINCRSGTRQLAHPNHGFALRLAAKARREAAAELEGHMAELEARATADVVSLRSQQVELGRIVYETRRAILAFSAAASPSPAPTARSTMAVAGSGDGGMRLAGRGATPSPRGAPASSLTTSRSWYEEGGPTWGGDGSDDDGGVRAFDSTYSSAPASPGWASPSLLALGGSISRARSMPGAAAAHRHAAEVRLRLTRLLGRVTVTLTRAKTGPSPAAAAAAPYAFVPALRVAGLSAPGGLR